MAQKLQSFQEMQEYSAVTKVSSTAWCWRSIPRRDGIRGGTNFVGKPTGIFRFPEPNYIIMWCDEPPGRDTTIPKPGRSLSTAFLDTYSLRNLRGGKGGCGPCND